VKLFYVLFFVVFMASLASAAALSWDVNGRENVVLSSIKGGPLYYPASTSVNFWTYPNFNATGCDTDEGCATVPVLFNGSWTSATGYWQWRSALDAGSFDSGPPFWFIVDMHRQVSINPGADSIGVKDEATTSARRWATQANILCGNTTMAFASNSTYPHFQTINQTTGGFSAGADGQNYTFSINQSYSCRYVMLWINATGDGNRAPALSEFAIRGDDAGAKFTFNATIISNASNVLNYSFDKAFGFKNASAVLWYGGNSYAATVTNDSTKIYVTATIQNDTTGLQNFYFRITSFTNDTNGAVWNTSTQTQYLLPFPLEVLYTTPAVLPSTETYKLLIADIPGALGVNSTFYWNNTNYTSVSGFASASSSWHNSSILQTSTGTFNFWWQITYLTSGGYSTFNTSVYTQTLTNVSIFECNATQNTTILAYYLQNEEDQLNITGTMKVDFIYSGSPELLGAQTFSRIKNNTQRIYLCISMNTTIYANSVLSYYVNDTYPIREHRFVKTQFTNATRYQSVYTNVNTIVKLTRFTLVGTNGLGLGNATLRAERYFVGNNTYLTVAMAITDSNGEASTYLRPSDTYHRISYIDTEGNIIKVFDPSIIVCDELSSFCKIRYSLAGTVNATNWGYAGRIAYSCSFNNSTTVLQCSVIDSSNQMLGANLSTRRFYGNYSRIECVDYQVGSSVTLNCLLNNTHTNYYTWELIGVFPDHKLAITSGSNEFSVITPLGINGLFIVLIFIVMLFMLGSGNPTMSVMGISIALFLAKVFQIMEIDDTIIGITLAVAIIIAYIIDR